MKSFRRYTAALVVGISSLVSLHGFASAAALHASARTVSTTFRLRVDVPAPPGRGYWVAYGPLAGRFGLIHLHATARDVFMASRPLPVSGRTVFTYLAASGVQNTRYGDAPAGKVQVIARFGPMTPLQLPKGPVVWAPASG